MLQVGLHVAVKVFYRGRGARRLGCADLWLQCYWLGSQAAPVTISTNLPRGLRNSVRLRGTGLGSGF